jgi:nucleoid DNA-binding protein
MSKFEDLTRKEALEAINLILSLMKEGIINNDHLLITSIGRFEIKNKRERIGRNPRSQESHIISSRKVVSFKASSCLHKQIRASFEKKISTGEN